MTKYLTEISGYNTWNFWTWRDTKTISTENQAQTFTRNGAQRLDYATIRLLCAVYLIISSGITAWGNRNSLFVKYSSCRR